jgi:flagellar hook-associated protein 3 FlgL
LTARRFNSVAEDPSSAARASTLHRSYSKNKDYLSLITDVQSKQDEQENALRQVTDMAKDITKNYALSALNGTNAELSNRKTYAESISSLQKSMVTSLNASYENRFVFAGTDGMNTPFVLSEDGTTLTYRGVNVDATQGSADYEKLTKYAQEKQYVDLGMGLTLDDSGSVVSSSAFNTALPGIKTTGYGKDSDGVSNNIVLLTGQLADTLKAETFDEDKYKKLLGKIDDLRESINNDVSKLGVQTNFLDSTKDRLESQQISLQTQMQNIESYSMSALAEAYTDFSWDQYTYNASLKLGTSILSSSFIDFMK